MRYIALDPGGAGPDGGTGYAVYESGFIDQGTLSGEHHYDLWRLFLDHDDYLSGRLRIICERFDNRGNQFAKLDSREYIGVVKLYEQTAQHAVAEQARLTYWQGSDVKKWASNDKLERAGWLTHPLRPNRHMNDAKRHLLYFLCHHATIPLKERDEMLARVISS